MEDIQAQTGLQMDPSSLDILCKTVLDQDLSGCWEYSYEQDKQKPYRHSEPYSAMETDNAQKRT